MAVDNRARKRIHGLPGVSTWVRTGTVAAEGKRTQRVANLRTIVDDLRSHGFTSARAIAAQLNERGILTPRGGAWHPTSAARLLSRLQV